MKSRNTSNRLGGLLRSLEQRLHGGHRYCFWTQARKESAALLIVIAFSWIVWMGFSAFRSDRWERAFDAASSNESVASTESSTREFLVFLNGLPGPSKPKPKPKSAYRDPTTPSTRSNSEARSVSPKYSYPPRLVTPALASIELNVIDSASLEALPEIGPVLAGRIVKYRGVLGAW